jgi:hypothetical protein
MGRRRAVLANVWVPAAAIAVFVLLLPVPPVAAQPTTPASGPSTPDDRARLLAGLPVSADSPLGALQAAPSVARHAASLSRTWQALDDQMLSRMRAWAGRQIDPRIETSAPLAYIFGGPDILTAHAMFPSAPVYVLTGLEPVGRVPPLETLAPAALETGLDNLRSSIEALPTRGYFITSYMGRDLSRTELRGVMPVLYLFLARAGHRLLEGTAICLDPAGQMQHAGAGVADGHVPGVRIVFQGDEGRAPQTLYYFSVDLEAGPLAKKPGFFQFMNALPAPNAYLKAASFILHDNRFAATRDFLLTRSKAILQDDSSVPFRWFKKNAWDLTFLGVYEPAVWIEHFEWVTQEDLKAAFAAAGPLEPLPFKTGYSKPGRSNLMLALARRSAG